MKYIQKMERSGPFRLVEQPSGRPTSSKITATSLVIDRDKSVIIGTSEGQIILHTNQREEAVSIILKSKKPVTRILLVSDYLLAICGNELFSLEAKTLSKKPPFQNLRDVCEVCANQHGPPDWGLCIITASPQSEDGVIHLFADLGSSQFEKLREIPLKGIVGTPMQACWYENVICVGGTKSAALIDDVRGTSKKIPIIVDAKRGPILLPLPDGRILLSSAGGLGVVIDLQGNPAPNAGAIVWSNSPISMVSSGPYVIVLLEDGIVEISASDTPGQVIQRLLIKNASAVLSSDNGLLGETLFESKEEDRKYRFCVGLSLQYSDAPYRIIEALPLRSRVFELLEEDNGDCSRAVHLARESFSAGSSEGKLFLFEKSIYLRAGTIIASKGTNFDLVFEYFFKAELNPEQLLELGGYSSSSSLSGESNIDNALSNLVRKDQIFQKNLQFRLTFIDYIFKWRAAMGSNQKLDTDIMLYLSTLSDSERLEKFSLDASNQCDEIFCLKHLQALGLNLASANLSFTRSETISVYACEIYQNLNLNKSFARCFQKKKPENPESILKVQELIDKHLDWILSNCDIDELTTIFENNVEWLFKSIPVDRILSAQIERPRRFILFLLQQVPKVPPEELGSALVYAMEEAISFNDSREKISYQLMNLATQSKRIAETILDLIRQSKFNARMNRERANCLGVLGKHREALKILEYFHRSLRIKQWRQFVQAE